MIELSVFLESFTGLMATFDKSFPDKAIRGFYELLSSQLTTEEFETACNKAYGCKFFPTPDELIGLAIGTIEERAEREWQDIDTPFSVVGLKALNAIGGWWYIKNQCTQPAIARKDFIESYCRHAKGASRSDFELPDPTALIAPAQDRPWSYLPIGTKRNKHTQQIETRWREVYLDELSQLDEAFNDLTDEIREQWVLVYLDRYAARNLRLVDGIHTKAHEKVPSYWNQKAKPELQWLHERARLYLKNLEGTDNEI
jgi:hypothetical protein